MLSMRTSGFGLLRFSIARWRAVWLVLFCSLALSPLLSRMHHVVHSGHGLAKATLQVGAPSDRFQMDRLFGQHADGSQVCQLLDHGNPSDGPLPHTTAAPPSWVGLPIVDLSQHRPAPVWLAFFEARAPPLFL
jgi:hypothetical protein